MMCRNITCEAVPGSPFPLLILLVMKVGGLGMRLHATTWCIDNLYEYVKIFLALRCRNFWFKIRKSYSTYPCLLMYIHIQESENNPRHKTAK